MGVVIQLARRRASRPRAARRVTFFFDLASPYTYLAAERVDRRFCDAAWRPAAGRRLGGPLSAAGEERLAATRRAVERRALELRMPLVWPERSPTPATSAMRAATLAVARGRGPAFAIAVGRLAFCGGFDVEDPRTLAEAAAAAGLDVDEALAAARDEERDRELEAAARALRAAGGTSLPAVRHAGALFCGEGAVTAAIVSLPSAASVRPAR